ncbi:MAG: TIM barrel protein, partial [Chloroflexaceae bacterium]
MTVLPPLRFAVCIETIFRDMPFEQRLEHIMAQGFSAFEFWQRDGKDMNITLALKMALRLDLCAFVGSTAPLTDPAQRSKFLDDITRAAGLAVDMSCENLIVYSGPAMRNVPRIRQRESIIEGLREAAPIAADADVRLVLEPRARNVDPAVLM